MTVQITVQILEICITIKCLNNVYLDKYISILLNVHNNFYYETYNIKECSPCNSAC